MKALDLQENKAFRCAALSEFHSKSVSVGEFETDRHATPIGALQNHPSVVLRRILREPLLHFLVAGAVLFGLGKLLDRSTSASAQQNRIQVSAPEIRRLREVWRRQWGRAPDSLQMKHLIDDYIHEETMYREALASGLDKDDTIIRRRLVEKMEFLSQELVSAEPPENDLHEYFQRNQGKFEVPAEVAFSHIYFSTSKRGGATENDARRLLACLRAQRISQSQISQLGDTFMLQSEYPLQTEQQIKELFGDAFASKLFQLKPGTWAGPIRSSYGFHLARISQKLPSRLPELSEVRNQVLRDFKNQRLQTASEAFYERLRMRYRVEVDNAALSTAEPQQDLAPSGHGSQGAESPDVD
jgi:hypothetical protein